MIQIIIKGKKSWYGTCWYDTTPHQIYQFKVLLSDVVTQTICSTSCTIAGRRADLHRRSWIWPKRFSEILSFIIGNRRPLSFLNDKIICITFLVTFYDKYRLCYFREQKMYIQSRLVLFSFQLKSVIYFFPNYVNNSKCFLNKTFSGP